MSIIKVDVTGLQSAVSSLNQSISRLQDLNSRMENLLGRMDASWEGNACEQYIATMRQRMEKATRMIGVLTEFRSYAQKACEWFAEQDESSASDIRDAF